MDVLVAIDRLDDFVHNAKTVPLSDAVRVDRGELLEHVDRLRTGLRAELSESYRSASMRMVEDLERLARDAPPVRLFSGVRVNKDQIYDVLDRMRDTIPEEIRLERGGAPAPPRGTALAGALDALDALVRGGRILPLSDDVRIDRTALQQAVVAVRAATEDEFPGAGRRKALECLARLESIAGKAKKVPLSNDVHLTPKGVYEQIEALRGLRG